MKPIVSLKLSQDENAEKLEKVLTQEQTEGTFEDLIGYVTDPREDELNPPYSEEEKRFAGRIRYWLRETRGDKNRISLFPVDEEGKAKGASIPLEEKVRDRLPEILLSKERETSEGRREYQEVPLYIQYNPAGGR